ncbi:MAG TPA: glycosyltransferase family 4 protein, partial [Polyangiaceae bacterium]|nr:glycosyltransferase family 4 protein [Polyangiaceae bacterium]
SRRHLKRPSRIMRVLFVTRKYPPRIGGMENFSYAVTTGYPEPKTIIALGRSQKHLIWFLPYVIARVALTASRYDVIHLGDPLLCAAGFVPRLLRRKVAITVHGLDLTFPARIYQSYLKLFLRAEMFIAISDSTRRLAVARGLEPVRVITIGVPERYLALKRAPNSDWELDQKRAGRVVLVTVGRLVRRKGVAWFVRHVLPQLSNVLYVVIGVGPDQDEILRAASDTGTTAALWLVGSVSDARMLELLSAADVFVMPNIEVPGDIEGFGIVAIEAAASGLPVVAARLEGIPDAIADGENGCLLPPGDASAFVTAIERLSNHPAERVARGERGRVYTEQHNSWPRIITRYVDLFTELAGAR